MNNNFSKLFSSSATNPTLARRDRTTLILLAILFCGAVLWLLGMLTILFQAGNWQHYGLALAASLLGIASLAAFQAVRGGNYTRAAISVIGGLGLTLLGVVVLTTSLGLALLTIMILLNLLFGAQLLVGREFIWSVVGSLILGVVIFLTETFITQFALDTSALESAFMIGTALLAAGVVVVIALQFAYYPMLTKLLAVILLVTLIPIFAISYTNIQATRQNLTHAADLNLQSAASAAAEEMDDFIRNNLDIIASNAELQIMNEYLALSPSARSGSYTETVLYDDLTALSHIDQTYISSVALLDKRGTDVADTVLSDVGENKSDRIYFSEAVKSGSPYVSPMLVSVTTGKPSIYFSAPVRDDKGNIIGVLRVRYNAEVLLELIVDNASRAGQDAFMIVFDENFIRLADSKVPDAVLKTLVPLPAEKLAELQSGVDPRLPAGTAEELSGNLPALQNALENMDTDPSFQSEFHSEEKGVIDTSAEQGFALRLNTQPWVLVIGQPTEIFLAPVAAERFQNLLIALIVAGLVSLAAFFVSQALSGPIVGLTNTALQIANGDFSTQAVVTAKDEVGTLADAFNTMTSRLRDSIRNLDRRASELATVAEVGTATATILNVNQLLQEVVDLTKERFDLYHSHIYLLDEAGHNLVLASGAGEPGRAMVTEGRSIPLDREQSLVARAARERKGVTVNDVTQAPDFLPNPLLPDTRSELAVPMIVGGRVIGVFDVQSNVIGRFTDSDINIQTTLAAQVATSIQNVRSFESAKTQAELESLVNAISQKIQRSTSVENTLQIAIQELGTAIGASRVRATIGTVRTSGVHYAGQKQPGPSVEE